MPMGSLRVIDLVDHQIGKLMVPGTNGFTKGLVQMGRCFMNNGILGPRFVSLLHSKNLCGMEPRVKDDVRGMLRV
jgi:hypothetical protein